MKFREIIRKVRMKTLFILIALLALTIGSSLVVTQKMRQQKALRPASEMAQPAVGAQVSLNGSIVGTTNKVLSIVISPASGDTDLSTFTLEATISGLDPASVNSGKNLVLSQELVGSSWSFPIHVMGAEGPGAMHLKLSGIHVSTTPFLLTGPVTIASFQLSAGVDPESIALTVNKENTKFYHKDQSPAPLSDAIGVSISQGGNQ